MLKSISVALIALFSSTFSILYSHQGSSLIPQIPNTADWPSYINSQYAFTFKYPPSLEVIVGNPIVDSYGPVEVINLVTRAPSSTSVTSVAYELSVLVRDKHEENLFKAGLGNISSVRTININSRSMEIYSSARIEQSQKATENLDTAIFDAGNYTFGVDFWGILSSFQAT
jgi:hypothetical protein